MIFILSYLKKKNYYYYLIRKIEDFNKEIIN